MFTLLDAIPWIAILVSLLAAIYARDAAREAKRANRLALQSRKEQIFRDMMEFQDLFRGMANYPLAHQIDAFRRQIETPSRLYFTKNTSEQVSRAGEQLWNSSRAVMALESPPAQLQLDKLSEAQSNLHDLAVLLPPILAAMEKELHVADA